MRAFLRGVWSLWLTLGLVFVLAGYMVWLLLTGWEDDWHRNRAEELRNVDARPAAKGASG